MYLRGGPATLSCSSPTSIKCRWVLIPLTQNLHYIRLINCFLRRWSTGFMSSMGALKDSRYCDCFRTVSVKNKVESVVKNWTKFKWNRCFFPISDDLLHSNINPRRRQLHVLVSVGERQRWKYFYTNRLVKRLFSSCKCDSIWSNTHRGVGGLWWNGIGAVRVTPLTQGISEQRWNRAERQTAVEHNVGLNFIGLMQSWQFNIYSNSKAVYTGGVCGCLFYFCSCTKKISC